VCSAHTMFLKFIVNPLAAKTVSIPRFPCPVTPASGLYARIKVPRCIVSEGLLRQKSKIGAR
jgi:hypothetical protein